MLYQPVVDNIRSNKVSGSNGLRTVVELSTRARRLSLLCMSSSSAYSVELVPAVAPQHGYRSWFTTSSPTVTVERKEIFT